MSTKFSIASATERGEAVFKNCAKCHGEAGQGNKELAAPSIAGLPEWYVNAQLHKFRYGVRGLHPKDLGGLRMRPMARVLNGDSDLDVVAKYVAKMPRPESLQTIFGNPVKGEVIYKTCSACHGQDGLGNEAVKAPPHVGASDWYLLVQLQNFKAKIRGGNAEKDPNGAIMVGMASSLDENAMKDVISYMSLLKPKK